MHNLIVIGGGAAGIFAALRAKEAKPKARVLLLEKTAQLLAKVRISGGGRCNVTHHCFDPKRLVKNYPRGEKELLGLFYRFGPQDTIEWFAKRGVKLKTERDGRMFPVTDSSETIISCLLKEAEKLGVEIRDRTRVQKIEKLDEGFRLDCKDKTFETKALLLATGSSPQGFAWAQDLGHTVVKPIPSLFTFNVPSSPLLKLSGISVSDAEVSVGKFIQRGPLLLTHFGFSGPAALKLSAFAARFLFEKNYKVELSINWVPDQEIMPPLLELKKLAPKKNLASENPFALPKALWKALLGPLTEKKFAYLTNHEIADLEKKLRKDLYLVEGKTTNKEEFVTCGGVELKEVNFKTMESKICPGLYFAGEILNIDGVTGGFNFQNAWATGYCAGSCAV